MSTENTTTTKQPAIPPLPPASGSALLPCPWCGAQPVISHGDRYHCPNDDCPAGGGSHYLATKEKWNTRSPNEKGVVQQLMDTLDGLVQECEYSESTGLPFNFTDGKGRWTQLEKAKKLLAALQQNDKLKHG